MWHKHKKMEIIHCLNNNNKNQSGVILKVLAQESCCSHSLLFFTGIYCCGIFCLIGISILETILVNFLKSKGAEMRSVEKTAAVSGRDGKSRYF